VPGPQVHFRFTAQWAVEEGMRESDAQVLAESDIEVDLLWPGSKKWGRHFNPTATLVFAPRYCAEAVRLELAGAHLDALVALGRALHCLQDGVGHGVLGLAHLKYRFGLLERNPDEWNFMPPKTRASIERVTRETVQRFLEESASFDELPV
jgi:hypothetical protein